MYNLKHFYYFLILALYLLSCGCATVRSPIKTENPAEETMEYVIQYGHSEQITGIIFSSDGKYIVSGSQDNTVKLWSTDGKLLRTMEFKEKVECVDISEDMRFIAAGSMQGNIRIWNFRGIQIKTFTAYKDSKVSKIIFSPDNQKIISSGRTIKIWNLNGDLQKNIIVNRDVLTNQYYYIRDIALSPDGEQIAAITGGGKTPYFPFLRDNTIALFDIKGRLKRKMIGHHGPITSLTFSQDNKFLISSEREIPRGSVMYSNSRPVVVQSPQGGRKVLLWNRDGEPVKTILPDVSLYQIKSLKTKGSFMGIGQDKIWFYNTDGKYLSSFPVKDDGFLLADISPSDKRIITVSQSKGDINKMVLYNNTGGQLLTVKKLARRSNRAFSVSFSPDGKYILSSHWNKRMKKWSIDGKLMNTFQNEDSLINNIHFSPDGEYILTSGTYVTLWNISGKIIRSFTADRSSTTDAIFSPDGKTILTCGYDKIIKCWDMQGRLQKTFKGHKDAIGSISLSGNGEYIISADYGREIRVWDRNGTVITSMTAHCPYGIIYDIDFSPDNKYFISGGNDNTVKLWSRNGTLLKSLKTDFNHILGNVRFSPDGKLIAATSGNTIKLWDSTGTLIHTFTGHTAQVNCLSFSSDGKRLVSGSNDATIRIWNINTGYHIVLLSDKEEWIVYDQDGYFDSSRHGGSLISIIKGLEAYTIDQFALKNNRPDLLLKKTGYADQNMIDHYYNQFRKRLNKSGILEDQLSNELHVPEVKITHTRQNEKYLSVSFHAYDSKYKLRSYNIYINDVPGFKAAKKQINNRSIERTETIELSEGRNKIEISCINEKGTESYRTLTYADYVRPAKSDLYFLGFGASQYRDKKLTLKYAHKDALDLSKLFRKMKSAYQNVHAKTFINSEVTLTNIKKAKVFLQNAKVDDIVILFIAGHGIYDRDQYNSYYYLTYNSNLSNLITSAVNFELMEDLLMEIAPRKKLLLIDTCESGEIDESVQQESFTIASGRGLRARTMQNRIIKNKEKKWPKRNYLYQKDRFIYNDLIRRSGAIVFSSSKGGEMSYESDLYQNGLFTEEIIRTLTDSEADTDKNGFISIDELRESVIKQVPRMSNNLQHPTVDRDNIYQKFHFPIIQ